MSKKQLIRKAFRDSVFKRDRYRCKVCGVIGIDRQGGDNHLKFHNGKNAVDLDAHHIQERNDTNYVADNGISVCESCHLKCEKYHISGGLEWEEGFHPNDLYKLIGSNWKI